MIVTDVNVIAYLYLPGPKTRAADLLYAADSDWAVPRLWRSELRNVLATYVREGLLSLDEALLIVGRAHELVAGKEYEVTSSAVLHLAAASRCTAYDCEYVALAEHLDVPLISDDKKLARAFPRRVRPLAAHA